MTRSKGHRHHRGPRNENTESDVAQSGHSTAPPAMSRPIGGDYSGYQTHSGPSHTGAYHQHSHHQQHRGGGTHAATAAPAATAPPQPRQLYADFSSRSVQERLVRGVFTVDIGLRAPAVGPRTIPVTPHLESWHSYWERFFPLVAPQSDFVEEVLQSNRGAGADGRGLPGVAIACPAEALFLKGPVDAHGNVRAMLRLLAAAEPHGCVQHVEVGPAEVVISFSTPQGAEIFSGIAALHGIVVAADGTTVGGSGGVVRRVRSSAPASSSLLIGPCTELDAPSAQALMQAMGAVSVDYLGHSQIFKVIFSSHEAAVAAHHLLHASLQTMFGLSLVFNAPNPAVDPFAVPYHAVR